MQSLAMQKLLVFILLAVSAIGMKLTQDGTAFVMVLLLFAPMLFTRDRERKKKRKRK